VVAVAGQSGQRRILRHLPLSCTLPIWLGRRFRSPIKRVAASETRAPSHKERAAAHDRVGLTLCDGSGAAMRASISGLSRYESSFLVSCLNGTKRIWLHHAMCSGLRSAMKRANA
jgi:hypothetical protein